MAEKRHSKNKTLREFIDEESAKESFEGMSPELEEVRADDTLNDSVSDFVFDKAFQEAVVKYNEEIWPVIDERHKEFVPAKGLLVRCKCKNILDDNGTIIPNFDTIAIPTQNGIGFADNMVNPYPFSKRALVVAVSEQIAKTYQTGDIVSVSHKARYIGKNYGNHNYDIKLRGEFLHPDSEYNNMPTDPLDEFYGYFIVYPFDGEVEGFLQKTPRPDKSEE